MYSKTAIFVTQLFLNCVFRTVEVFEKLFSLYIYIDTPCALKHNFS